MKKLKLFCAVAVIVLLFSFVMAPTAAFAAEETPEDPTPAEEVDGQLTEAKVGEVLNNWASLFLGLVVLVVGLVKIVDAIKILLPKTENVKWTEVWRPRLIQFISVALGILTMFVGDIDAFSMSETLSTMFPFMDASIVPEILTGSFVGGLMNLTHDHVLDRKY